MSDLHFSPEARFDLDSIWDYIASDLENVSAAQETVERILDSTQRLTSFPQMGAPLSSVAEVETDYRFIVCGSYLAFYRVVGDHIYIDRILYGARDYLRILFGDLERHD